MSTSLPGTMSAYSAGRERMTSQVVLESFTSNGYPTDEATLRSPLYYLIERDDFELFEYLIDLGVSVFRSRMYNDRLLHYASQHGRLKMSALLVEKGLELTEPDEYGDMPLHSACDNGQVEVARFLISKGAPVNALNSTSHTPLHMAAEHGHLDVCALLLNAGADATLSGHLGTPFHRACTNPNVSLVNLLLTKQAEAQLLKASSEVKAIKEESVQLERKRILNSAAYSKRTALHIATHYGLVDVIRCLVNQGADIEARDHDWQTPLLTACRRGKTDAAWVLIKLGADLYAVNSQQVSSLDFARSFGNFTLVKLLWWKGLTATDPGGGLSLAGSAPFTPFEKYCAAESSRRALLAFMTCNARLKTDKLPSELMRPLWMHLIGHTML